MTVDFFLGGWPKTGSTSLDYYLSQHPDIYMCPVKETYFHCTDILQDAEATDMGNFYPYRDAGSYKSLFAAQQPNQIAGESSVFYVISKAAPKNLAAQNPDAKLVLILRDPLEVVDSWFHYLREHAREVATSLDEALELQSLRAAGDAIPPNTQSLLHVQYDTIVDYANHLARVQEFFTEDRLHIVLYDTFREDPITVLQELFAFLNVDSQFEPDLTKQNVSRQQRFANLHRLVVRQKAVVEKVMMSTGLDSPNSPVRRVYRGIFSRSEQRIPLSGADRERLKKRFEPVVRETQELVNMDLLNLWGYL